MTACGLLLLGVLPAARAFATVPASPWHGVVIQDIMAVVSGGNRRGLGAPSLAHLNLTLHGNRWGGSKDTTLYVDVLGTGGSSISARAGDIQGLDNIEAPDTLRLYAAWWQHDLGSPRTWLRLGLQDYNALFDNLDTASLFINSSFGIEPTISESGVSIFPVTTPGAVVHWQGAHGAYVLGGLFGGVPGRPGDPYGTHVGWHPRDGVFSSLEAGLASDGTRPGKLAVGAWIDTSRHHDPALYPQRNLGLYLIGETRLWGHGSRTLDGFVQWGSAMPRARRIGRYLGMGLRLNDVWVRGDSLGLGMARAYIRSAPTTPGGAETSWELTWSAPVNAYLQVQPDLQYIRRPGGQGTVPDALVAGVRLQLAW